MLAVFQSAQTHFILPPKTWSYFCLFWEATEFWLRFFIESSSNCLDLVLIIFWPLLSFVSTSIVCSSLMHISAYLFSSGKLDSSGDICLPHSQYFWCARLFSLEGEIGDLYFFNAIMFPCGQCLQRPAAIIQESLSLFTKPHSFSSNSAPFWWFYFKSVLCGVFCLPLVFSVTSADTSRSAMPLAKFLSVNSVPSQTTKDRSIRHVD